jgi:hypothetical protein
MDFYLNRQNAYERLLEEYKKHKKLIVAFDFDDTVYDFHKKGRNYWDVIQLLKECKNLGFVLTLFTDLYLDKQEKALEYCKEYGIEPDYINETPPSLPFGYGGKPYYNILLDDRAGFDSSYENLKLLVTTIKNDLQHNSSSV